MVLSTRDLQAKLECSACQSNKYSIAARELTSDLVIRPQTELEEIYAAFRILQASHQIEGMTEAPERGLPGN